MKLIAVWSSNECLYNTKHSLYKNKHARQHALSEMCDSMQAFIPDVSIEDIKNKTNNLRSQYSRELAKQRDSARSGAGTEDLYEPAAYWFPHMHFLKDYVTTRKGKSNVDDSDVSSKPINHTGQQPIFIYLQYLEPEDRDQMNGDTQDDSFSSIIEGPGIPPPPKKRRATDDGLLNHAASALESIATMLAAEKDNRLDDVHTFGEHIKAELYALPPRDREELKFKLTALIYEFKLART